MLFEYLNQFEISSDSYVATSTDPNNQHKYF